MTLLELLVKELPSRGGWPSLADNCQTYSNDKRAAFFFDKAGFKVPVGFVISMNDIETSNNSTRVTRDQYEAAIASQQPVWDGEGLPPVGCECEFNAHERGWRKCSILYVSEYTILLLTDRPGAPEEVFDPDDVKLRPIRTEAERKREASISAMREFFGHASGLYNISGLYEEIASGKIPGVELTK